jgi:hypothetical protein
MTIGLIYIFEGQRSQRKLKALASSRHSSPHLFGR